MYITVGSVQPLTKNIIGWRHLSNPRSRSMARFETGELEEEITSSFSIVIGIPFIATFTGHRLVPEFSEVKCLLEIEQEDKFMSSLLYHVDKELQDLNKSIQQGFKLKGWQAILYSEPIAKMGSSKLNARYIFQILDVDVYCKHNMYFCNIHCFPVEKFIL